MEQEDRYFFSSKEATKYPNGNQTSRGSLMQQIGNLVICHVFQKKRVNGKAGGESAEVCEDNINISINEDENVDRYNLMMMRDGLSSSSCSDDGDSCVSSCSSSRVLNDEVSSSYSCGTLGYGNHQDASYI
nr:NAC12 protein [Ipomoea trifida]